MPSRSFFQPPKSGLNAPAQYPATDPPRLSVNVHNERRNAYAKVTKRTSRLAPEKAVFRPALACAHQPVLSPEKAMSSYWQKLKDPRWQKRRLEILSAAEFACQVCFDSSSTLHVHHLKYDKGKDPWEYTDAWLVCLCEACHEEMHAAKNMMQQAVAGLTGADLERLTGYAFTLSGLTFELGDKGIQSMKIDPGGYEAVGSFDAIRHFLEPAQELAEELPEFQVGKLLNERGELTRRAIWGVMQTWLERRRTRTQ
jgi:5-methylcytosine-specific restriction endonuclease McrA